MLEREIRFKIVVPVEIVGLAVPVSPVLVVFQAISRDFVVAEFRGTLFMPFGRTEGSEQQRVPGAYPFRDIQHVGPRADIRPVDIASPADIRAEQAYAPALSQLSAVQADESFSCTVVRDVRTSVNPEFGCCRGSDYVDCAADRVV